jgi:hypothetical protein
MYSVQRVAVGVEASHRELSGVSQALGECQGARIVEPPTIVRVTEIVGRDDIGGDVLAILQEWSPPPDIVSKVPPGLGAGCIANHVHGANPPQTGPGTLVCNACHGKGAVPHFATHYPFSEENVQEFAAFLRECGGFRIC